MIYKLFNASPRKYLYQIPGNKNTFLNLLYFIRKTEIKTNIVAGSRLHKKYCESRDRLYDFYHWCELQELDPLNFIQKNENYNFTKDPLCEVELDINHNGLAWKHVIEENIANLNFDNVYNLRYNDGILYYSYLASSNDFLEEYKSAQNMNEVVFIVDRKTEMRLRDYLQLGFYDFEVRLDIERNDIYNSDTYNLKLTTDNGKAFAVYKDFFYFNENNKVECKKCSKLVSNAFDDYMIQFYMHDGCNL